MVPKPTQADGKGMMTIAGITNKKNFQVIGAERGCFHISCYR